MKPYELLDHTSDIRIRASGETIDQLFENMARGMFEQIADLSKITGQHKQKITVAAVEAEELLIEWLNELLYLCFVKKYVFNTFKVKKILHGQKLEAEAFGLKLTKKNQPEILKREIKAATYHQLKIIQEKENYSAEVTFDV